METIEKIGWTIAVLAILGIGYAAVNAFVEGGIAQLSWPW